MSEQWRSAIGERFVMLVDDDRTTADMYATFLRQSGFGVEVLSDAAALFEALDRSIPDAVILDWQLVGISGGDIFRLLRRDPRTARVPVVFLSNHSPGALSLSDEDHAKWLVKAHTTPMELATELERIVSSSAA